MSAFSKMGVNCAMLRKHRTRQIDDMEEQWLESMQNQLTLNNLTRIRHRVLTESGYHRETLFIYKFTP